MTTPSPAVPPAHPGPSATAVALRRVTAALPGGGEARPGQEQMAEAVARAIERERHLAVQAGTGTGKSLAYLVPAVLSGRKVVVATATTSLQDQLGTKDLPFLEAHVGRPFTYAVLKGRRNYLCRQRAAELDQRGVQTRLDDAGPDEPAPAGAGPALAEVDPSDNRLVAQVRRLLDWAQTSDTGDRADLGFEPSERAWSMVSVGPRECPGAFRCPSGDQCFVEAARAAAAAADVVVVNTHLYGSHLASGGMVLPAHDVVVFDEAHELEGVMTQSLGVELAPGRFRALSLLARPFAADEAGRRRLDDVSDVGDRLAAALGTRIGERVLAPSDGTGRAPAGDGDAELGPLLELATARLDRVGAMLSAGAGGDGEGRRVRAQNAAGHLAEDLARLAGRGPDDVVWVDGTPRQPVLRLSPIDVGPLLATGLWPHVTAILTSATLPLRLTERLGLDQPEVDQLDVGSPFDYRNHSLLYVPRHLPDPRRPGAEGLVHEELEALIRAAGGRTLALFTSRRATEAAAAALADRLDVELLVQGERPKGRLLEAFATDETSCLFATMGFWQGVDVPGRSLMLVTLDRLPFARPDDPLLQARRDRAGDQAFQLVDIPRAATLLAQGAGRLIRTAEDRGVVAVLDPRLATATYRRVLLAALPPMRRSIDRRQVEAFLAEARGVVTGTPSQ